MLRDFERLLMRRHRFALADVLRSVQKVVGDLLKLQQTLTAATAALPSDKRVSGQQDVLAKAARLLEKLVESTTEFAGQQELETLLSGAKELRRLLETLTDWRSSDVDVYLEILRKEIQELKEDGETLEAAAQSSGEVCALLSRKRDYLARFLDEAGQLLENSNARRVTQCEAAIEQFTEEYQQVLQDEQLQRAKQLRFGIQAIETSMSTMLLPHFEICRTITTANAKVQAATLTPTDCNAIDAFVRTAARLKTGDVTFRSVFQDVRGFLAQLELFEKAASKDAFFVLSSALKLQFRESLDQELFLAYVEDWNAKRQDLQLTETSEGYQAATSRLQDLKTAIVRAQELAQTSSKKLALDDPTRKALIREVVRIFEEEGGAIMTLDVLG